MHRWRRYGLWIALVLVFGLVVGTTGQTRIYKYQRPDGVWVFTDDPSEVPDNAKTVDSVDRRPSASPSGGRDLAAELDRRLAPRTAIERARIAVVAVKSSLGAGSGFFITDNGFILTNRHVIRTLEHQQQAHERRIEEIEAEIERHRTAFADQQRRLDRARRQLETYRDRMDTDAYRQREQQLEEWQHQVDGRQSEFQGRLDDYRRKKRDFDFSTSVGNLSRNFTIKLADKSERYVYLAALSQRYDLALLKLDGYRTPFLEPASNRPPVGERVFAVGNPVGIEWVSAGILAGYEGVLIKTDAKIYPGNSGGPLVTGSGRVLGINTFKRLTHHFEGMGFAISLEQALQEFADHLP